MDATLLYGLATMGFGFFRIKKQEINKLNDKIHYLENK